MDNRWSRVGGLGLTALAVMALAYVVGRDAGSGGYGAPLLPDLTMSPPTGLHLAAGPGAGHVLRFTSVVNNIGQGDLLIDGTRTASGWSLHQRVELRGGGSESRPLTATLVWGGDGHDHWHVAEAARYRLEPVKGAVEGHRSDQKVGFCFFDAVPHEPDRPGAPAAAVHVSEGCGAQDDDEVAMGLSVGWGDRYRASLPGQWIDITGLREGRYRLLAEADPSGLFAETDTGNNEAVVEFRLVLDGGVPGIEAG